MSTINIQNNVENRQEFYYSSTEKTSNKTSIFGAFEEKSMFLQTLFARKFRTLI